MTLRFFLDGPSHFGCVRFLPDIEVTVTTLAVDAEAVRPCLIKHLRYACNACEEAAGKVPVLFTVKTVEELCFQRKR